MIGDVMLIVETDEVKRKSSSSLAPFRLERIIDIPTPEQAAHVQNV